MSSSDNSEPSSADSDEEVPLTELLNAVKLTDRNQANLHIAPALPPTLTSPAIALRPYQQRLLDDADALFVKGHRSVLAFLPTGGGKTRVGASAIAKWVLESGVGKHRCLFIVNRRSLLLQTRSAFLDLGFESSWLCMIGGGREACSTRHPEWDDAAAPPIGIATVQSLHEAFLAAHPLTRHTLVVIDEAHAAAAPSYIRLISALPSTARVLGLTATPFRTAADESLATVFPAAAWGPSVSNLIAQKILVPPVVHAPEDLFKPKAGCTKALLASAVTSWQRRGDGERTVAFCASVADSRRLAELFQQAGVVAEHIDAETPDKLRARAFEQLRDGTLTVLCNVDVLSEGFDEPRIGCVLLLRHTESRRVYVQQVGRGLRTAPGKSRCIVLDEVGATWRFGPLTGPIRSDYSWEGVCKDSAVARALLHRCRCGVLSHREVAACPSCGTKRFTAGRAPLAANVPFASTSSAAAASAAGGKPKLVPFGAALPKATRPLSAFATSACASARDSAVPLGGTRRPVQDLAAVPPLVRALSPPSADERPISEVTQLPPRSFLLPGGSIARDPDRAPFSALAKDPTKAPNHFTPNESLPNDSAPTESVSNHSAPNHSAPNHSAPNHSAPNHSAPKGQSAGGQSLNGPAPKVVFSSAALAATARAAAAAANVGTITGSVAAAAATAIGDGPTASSKERKSPETKPQDLKQRRSIQHLHFDEARNEVWEVLSTDDDVAARKSARPSFYDEEGRPLVKMKGGKPQKRSAAKHAADKEADKAANKAAAKAAHEAADSTETADPTEELLGVMSTLAIAAKHPADPSATGRPPPPSTSGLPPAWVVEYSEKRQRWYFFNKKTAETTWRRPEAVKPE